MTPAQPCCPSGPSPSCSWHFELCNRDPKTLSFSTEFLSGLDLFLEPVSRAVWKGCLLSGTLLVLNLRSLPLYARSPFWLGELRVTEEPTPNTSGSCSDARTGVMNYDVNSACHPELSQHLGKCPSTRPHLLSGCLTVSWTFQLLFTFINTGLLHLSIWEEEKSATYPDQSCDR